jgi:hypothetical protein
VRLRGNDGICAFNFAILFH